MNIRRLGYCNFGWQRNYYERVIRSDSELDAIRRYIVENPLKWNEDPENPKKKSGIEAIDNPP